MAFRDIVTAAVWDGERARSYVADHPGCVSMVDEETTPLYAIAALPFDKSRTDFLYECCPGGTYFRFDYMTRSPFHTAIFHDNAELVRYYVERDPGLLTSKTNSQASVAQYAAKQNAGSVCAYIGATRPDLFDEITHGDLPIVETLHFSCYAAFDAIFAATRHRMHMKQYNPVMHTGVRVAHAADCQQARVFEKSRCWQLVKEVVRTRATPPTWNELCPFVFKRLLKYYQKHNPSVLVGMLPRLARLANALDPNGVRTKQLRYALKHTTVERLRDADDSGTTVLHYCCRGPRVEAFQKRLEEIAEWYPFSLFLERGNDRQIALPFGSPHPKTDEFFCRLLAKNAVLLFSLDLPKQKQVSRKAAKTLFGRARTERDFLFVYYHCKSVRHRVLRAHPAIINSRLPAGATVGEHALNSRRDELARTYLKIVQYVDVNAMTTRGRRVCMMLDWECNYMACTWVSNLMTPTASPARRGGVLGETSMLFVLSVARSFASQRKSARRQI